MYKTAAKFSLKKVAFAVAVALGATVALQPASAQKAGSSTT